MKILLWIKDKAVWILGAVGLFFSVLFAVKYERQRIERMKIKAKLLKEVREYEQNIARNEGADDVLKKSEEAAQEVVLEAKLTLDKLEREVPQRSADEIADRFNTMYGYSHRSPADGRSN